MEMLVIVSTGKEEEASQGVCSQNIKRPSLLRIRRAYGIKSPSGV